MARSSVLRLGFGGRLDELIAAGATVDEITDDINGALERAGREERVSRSAVGRAAQNRAGLLAAKRQQDIMLDALREAGPGDDRAVEGRLEVLRLLVFQAVSQALGGGETLSPADIKDIASALLNTEKAGHLSDRRIAEAEARATARAADRGEKAARRQGLSAGGAAKLRAAIEGRAA